MKKILIGIILLIALLPIFVSATNWYARQYTPGGYGTSDGASYATAFNGISYIGTGAINWNLIRPGDTLYICGFHDGGNYDYAIYLPRPVLYINGKSGTQASPITIRGDCPGDAATIFGAGMQINSGWTLHDATNNIYKQAYSPLPSNYATITQQAFERYKTADKVNGIVRLNRPGNMNFAYWSPSSYYLDTDNTLYYKPASGSAADYTFYAVYEAPNINFQWAEYFIVKNINLMACANPSFGCNIGIREGANHITIDGVSTRWVSGAGAAIGIGPNNTYITIKNSHIRDAMNGIYFTNNVQHIVVSDNEIYNLDQEGYYYKTLTNRGDHHGIALQGGGDDMIIERNNIHNIGGEGIVWYYDPALTSQMTNVVIRYNLIHDVADLANRSIWPATSQRGIEFGGDHLSNVSIHDNYIYGNIIYNIGNPADDPQMTGTGIRLKSPVNINSGVSWYVYNNVIYNANLGLYVLESHPGFAFKNNIIMNSRTYNTYFLSVANVADVVMANNVYYPDGTNKFTLNGQTGNFQTWQSLVQDDANSKVANPLFLSPVNDFHVQSGSPAIDAGAAVGITQDYDGNTVPNGIAPDIGVYEYQGSGSCAPADLNCDTYVNVQDLAIVTSDFGKTTGLNNAKSDTNSDGIVDIYDVVYVASRIT